MSNTESTYAVYAYDVEGEPIAHPYRQSYDNLTDASALAYSLNGAVPTTFSVRVDSVAVVREDRTVETDNNGAPYTQETRTVVIQLP